MSAAFVDWKFAVGRSIGVVAATETIESIGVVRASEWTAVTTGAFFLALGRQKLDKRHRDFGDSWYCVRTALYPVRNGADMASGRGSQTAIQVRAFRATKFSRFRRGGLECKYSSSCA